MSFGGHHCQTFVKPNCLAAKEFLSSQFHKGICCQRAEEQKENQIFATW
jgi:hypothetical protein